MDGSRQTRRRTLEIFSAILDLPTSQRPPALARECGDDLGLRRRVEELLAGIEDESFLADGTLFERPETAGFLDELAGSEAGEVWGRYRTVGELGRGGMGVVFRAERADGAFEHEVALKVLPPGAGDDDRRRFELERQLLAQLDHPAIARLLDGGIGDSGRPYLVMELVEGTPITEHCASKELPVEEVLRLFLRVCEAVEAAHRRLIVHRDIKPSNVLVRDDGTVKLLDFGIAKLLDPERGGETRVLHRLGTLDYVSPEMYRGEPVGPASDVYQLGVLLYELLTGRLPRPLSELAPAERDRALTQDVTAPPSLAAQPRNGAEARGAAARLRRRRRVLPKDLDTIVLTALRADPQRRYGSARGLRQDVERFLAGYPVLARGDSLLYAARKLIGRHRLPAALIAAAAVLIVGVVFAYTLLLRDQRAAARDAARRAESARIESERAREGADAAVGYLLELIDSGNPDLGGSADVPARELFAEAADRLDEQFPDHPLLRARLMESLSRVLFRLGDYRRARRLATESVALRERGLDAGHPLLAESLVALADVEHWDGSSEAGAEYYQRAIAILDDANESGPLLERAIANFSRLRVFQDRPEEGLALAERARGLCEQRLGADAIECLLAGVNEAAALRWMGRTEEARDLFARHAARYERELGADHPRFAGVLAGQASAEIALGNLDEAERLFRREIEIERSALGPRHPNVARGLYRLAVIADLRGDFAGAVVLLEESLSIYEAVDGPDSPSLTGVMSLLVEALLAAGRVEEAEARADRAYALVEGRRGSAPRAYSLALATLGHAARHRGLFELAEARYREALELRAAEYGHDHWLTARVRYCFGRALLELGRAAEAEGELERAHRSGVRLLGTRSLDTARILDTLAASRFALGETEAARAAWATVVEIRAAQLPPDHPELIASRERLARLPAVPRAAAAR